MKLPQIKQFRWNYLALAFLIPLLCFMGVQICGGYEPFGNGRSMLYSDMYHQYYPFFVNFRDALRSGDGLLYNWSIGMGLDNLGLFAYYLASPLYLLGVLVPDTLVMEYFSILVPVKLGLASLFFAIFLKKLFRKDDLSISLFGGFYGLCAWALGYQWNLMWLDAFALLPLVALGTVSLLRQRKVILYTVCLFLSIYTNYYIGFFTCIFVLLVFICYQICRFESFGRLFTDLCTIALFSILAIGMTAILSLPSLAALQTTYSSVNSFPEGFRLNIASENTWKGLLDAMRQVAGNLGGGQEPTFKEGLPNLYCGVGTVILAFVYLTCRQVRVRDKICTVFLLLFFAFSFVIRQLDYIWHGFHFPNMIPYRFSFLFSFVLLYMAYKAFLLRNRLHLWQLIFGGMIACALFILSDNRTDPVFIAYNLVFLLLYLGVLIFPILLKRPKEADKEKIIAYHQEVSQRRSICSYALAGVMAIELILCTINFGIAFPYTGITNYPKGTNSAASAIAYMQQLESDDLFYRAETTHSQTLNDGALNGYHGISTFTSSANVSVTKFMVALGYGAKESYNRYCFEESSPVSNLFLGLKYMLERDDQVEPNPYFDDVYRSGSVHLLKNNAYLPLGFLANVQLANVDFAASADTFPFQNRLLSAASGIAGNAWQVGSREWISITSDDVEVTTGSALGHCNYKSEGSGTVTYTFTANQEGLMCLDLTLPKRNSYTVLLNGEILFKETYSIPQTTAVSYVQPGDIVQVDLTCKAGEKSTMTIFPAILNEQVFRSAHEVLSQSTLKLTHFSSTRVEGTIDCNRDGLLYTSIPQNGNWRAIVDGLPADIVLIGDCMIGIPMAEGSHTVAFVYHNKAFSLGWKVTLGCAAVFAAITLAIYLPRRKKGRFEK